MNARVRKWGNSLGIRIPKVVAEEVEVSADSEVQISVTEGKILISPLRRKSPSLRQLLSRVTDSNLHDEVDSGHPVGREAW